MKKILSVFLAAMMILGLLAGCTGGEAESQTPEQPSVPAEGSTNPETPSNTPEGGKQYEGVELTMWSMWSSSEPQAQVIQEAAAAFEEQTGAKVNIEWKGREINQILSASLESGEKFDIFEDDYQRIAQVYCNYTYDLTDMAAAAGYASHSYACLNDQAVAWVSAALTPEGAEEPVPGFLNSIVEQPQVGGVFYDKAAFKNAGITAEPATWSEFMDACKKLADNGIAPIALDSAYSDFTFYHQLVRHLGEEKIQELTLNGGWSGTAAEAAAQEVIDLVNAGYLVDGAPDEYPSSQNKIGFGQAAMIVCANYVTSEVNNTTGTEIEWGLFGYPAVDGGADNSSAYAGANSLAITRYCENPQAAFDFLMFLTTGECDQKMADAAGQIPADTRNTAPASQAGTIETLLAAEKPMSWCSGLYANSDLTTSIKTICNQLYEGRYATGADFTKALDALY